MNLNHRTNTLKVIALAMTAGAGPAYAQSELAPSTASSDTLTQQPSPTVVVLAYDGELRFNGQPMTGLVDLRFSLYDAPINGARLGDVLKADGADVTNGRVAVDLPFKAEFLTGGVRYLQVSVRRTAQEGTESDEAFIDLSPRRSVLMSPVSLVQQQAAGPHTPNGQSEQSSTQTGTTLTVGPMPLPENASSSQPQGHPDATSSGTTLPSNGGGLDMTDWQMSGEIIFYNDGPVGIGTSNPTNGRLEVEAATGTAVRGNARSIGGSGVLGAATAPTGLTTGVYGFATGTGGRGVYGDATASTGNAIGVYGHTRSDAGRGVYGYATHATGLTYGVYGSSTSEDGRGVFGDALSATGETIGGHFVNRSNQGRGVQAAATSTTGTTIGVLGINQSSEGTGVFGSARALTGLTRGVYGFSASDQGQGVFGDTTSNTGTTFGVFGHSRSNAGRGIFGRASNTSGTTYGVHGEAFSDTGTGVFGDATETAGQNFGVHGRSASDIGFGVFGESTSSTGASVGVHGSTPSTSGRGVFGQATSSSGQSSGVYGLSLSSSGDGVHGLAATFDGTTSGVYGEANSTQGAGVRGVANNTVGANMGVQGVTPSSSGVGVQGDATSTSGLTSGVQGTTASASGRGVSGIATNPTGLNYGVYGRSDSSNGYAGYFVGNTYVSEDLGIGVLDPQAKLHVDGITRADGFEFVEPKLRVNSIGEAAFVSRLSSDVITRGTGSGGAFFASATTGSMIASVVLPDGATVTGMVARVLDSSGSDNLNVELRRHNGSSYSSMASIVSSGSTGVVNYTDLTITNEFIDNETFAYSVLVSPSANWDGANLKVAYIIVRYTVDEAD